MKSILILIVSAFALSSQAVSFKWASDAKVTFEGTSLQTAGNTATAYLVYLGTDGTWSFGTDITGVLANVTDASVGQTTTKTSGSANVKGKFGPENYGLDGNQGYSYGVVLTYTDSSNDIWYNLSSDTYTISSGTADNATGLSHNFTFSFDKGGEVTALSSAQVGSGWYKVTPVPEPSSAALALAGLALLIKRRKA